MSNSGDHFRPFSSSSSKKRAFGSTMITALPATPSDWAFSSRPPPTSAMPSSVQASTDRNIFSNQRSWSPPQKVPVFAGSSKKSEIQLMLADLPSQNPSAFSNFNPNAVQSPASLYLPSHDDAPSTCFRIPMERRHCLIRAISRASVTPTTPSSAIPSTSVPPSSKTFQPNHTFNSSAPLIPPTSTALITARSQMVTSSRAEISPEPKRRRRSATAVSHSGQPSVVGPTLTDSERLACLNVALSAANRQPNPPNWLQNMGPYNTHNHSGQPQGTLQHALAYSVRTWSVSDLKEYLAKAGISSDSMPRSEMARLVLRLIANDP